MNPLKCNVLSKIDLKTAQNGEKQHKKRVRVCFCTTPHALGVGGLVHDVLRHGHHRCVLLTDERLTVVRVQDPGNTNGERKDQLK